MEINDVMNKDFMKILNFLESYESGVDGMFTQQTVLNANISYYMKVSHYMGVLRELGIIEEVVIKGTGNIKLYKFNKNSYIYLHIKSLMGLIENKETNWGGTNTSDSDIFSGSDDGRWHEDISANK